MLRDHTLLSRFPKQRPELPDAYRKIYAEHYKRNREGGSPASSLSQKMESWMHRKVAEDVAREPHQCRTLEIGAGNLNHLRYESGSGRYDVVESVTDLVSNPSGLPLIPVGTDDNLSEFRAVSNNPLLTADGVHGVCVLLRVQFALRLYRAAQALVGLLERDSLNPGHKLKPLPRLFK